MKVINFKKEVGRHWYSDGVFTHLDKYEIFVGIGNNTTGQRIHEVL